MIRTKKKKMVPFVPNEVQTLYLDQLSAKYPPIYGEDGTLITPGFDWRNGQYTLRGIREDILKARQQGMSTLWLALYFLDTINTPLTQTLIVAHDSDTTELLFQIVHRYYINLPPDKRRPKKYSNRREIRFADTDSLIYVGTAGATNLGRSQTINNVHESERAFWADGNDVESGLMESVPEEGNVTRETTANGFNDYYAERQVINEGNSVYTPRFFGWFLNSEYRRPAPDDFKPTEEEEKLMIAFGLDLAQVFWRRMKILGNPRKFAQEYPATEEEAFLVSGNPYFDRKLLVEILNRLKGDEFKPLPAEAVFIPSRFNFNKQADGFEDRPLLLPYLRTDDPFRPPDLQVWDMPQEGKRYVISADTAEGINDRGDHDYDSADVWDADTWQQVAHLHGRYDPTEYGLMLAALGWWYNTALIGVERNNHGHTVLSSLMNIAHYPLMTRSSDRQSGIYEHQEYDENLKPTIMRAGWPTTRKSKPVALDGLAISITNADLKIRNIGTIAQLMSYVKLPNNKSGAESGHDDRVTSAAIGDVLLKMRPIRRPKMAPMIAEQHGPQEDAVLDAQAREAEAWNALPPELQESLARLKGSMRIPGM